MKIKNKKAGFTLVELIIVITILAILGTIGFVSFQSYTSDARDSNRLASIASIQSGLEVFKVKSGKYPMTDIQLILTDSGGLNIIGYQGFFGEKLSSIIKMNQPPLDPSDKSEYIYSVNNSQNKYQLMAFLEKKNISYLNEVYADNSSKTPKLSGNNLGILLNQDNSIISGTGTIDIVNYTGTILKVYVDNNTVISGTGGQIKNISMLFDKTKSYSKSCKEILQTLGDSQKDGYYSINPTGTESFQVYCDMTTQGGGWTLIFNQSNVGDFWDGVNKKTNFTGSTNCYGFEENCVNKAYSTIKVTDGIMLDGGEKNIIGNNYASRVSFSGVTTIKDKTLYYLFNNTGSSHNSTETSFWQVTDTNIIKGFDNSIYDGYNNYNSGSNLYRDYGWATYKYKEIALNEDQINGADGLISGSWANSCKWPNNPCTPSHWYKNYRFWIR